MPEAMPNAMTNATLEKLIWALIFGGLIVLSVGVFVERQNLPLGWLMVLAGAAIAAAGAVLVFVRSRRPD